MARLEFDAAEWDAADDDRKALVTGCTDFNLGVPVPEWDTFDADGRPIGDPVRYVVSHPRLGVDDMLRATEALDVPAKDVPKKRTVGGDVVVPARSEQFAVVDQRLRPRDGDGNVTEDKIAAFRKSLEVPDGQTPKDIGAELAKRRPAKQSVGARLRSALRR